MKLIQNVRVLDRLPLKLGYHRQRGVPHVLVDIISRCHHQLQADTRSSVPKQASRLILGLIPLMFVRIWSL